MSATKKVQDDGNQSGSDMQMESDEDMEDEQVDIEEEEQEADDGEDDEDEAGDDGDGEEDAEAEVDEEQSGEDVDEVVKVPILQPKLKITLKLPANNTSSTSAGTATPDDAEMDYAAFKRTPKRRAKTRVIQDVDIESEDPSLQSDSDQDESMQGPPSHSTGTPTATTKPMTTRQAVLASVVDPTHVSLNEGSRSKKQPLNETELALRREETARKRKNLSEKKLEDEKAETINRLLKKQSRPKNKRTKTTDSSMPAASGSRTPKIKRSAEDADEGEAEEEEDEAMDVMEQPEEIKPTMYRWVSSLREVEGEGEKKIQMGITFSVPEILFLPTPSVGGIIGTKSETPDPDAERERAARGPGVCAVDGCGKPRKYRVPKDWTIGACDSTHLRIVAGRV